MTPRLRALLAVCGPELATAQQIANRLPGRLPGKHVLPKLHRLEEAGHLERDTAHVWHRWRVK